MFRFYVGRLVTRPDVVGDPGIVFGRFGKQIGFQILVQLGHRILQFAIREAYKHPRRLYALARPQLVTGA